MAARTSAAAAGKPAAKTADKPAAKAVEKPAAAAIPKAAAVAKPAAKAVERSASKPTQGKTAKPADRPASGRAEKPAARATGKAGTGTKQAVKPKAKPAKGTAHAAAGKRSGDIPAPSDFQAEVDLLRGQIGELNLAGVWTSKNPPKFAGIYGKVLQGLDAGVALSDAFHRLVLASANTRDNAAKILKLVQDHKTPTFNTVKGK